MQVAEFEAHAASLQAQLQERCRLVRVVWEFGDVCFNLMCTIHSILFNDVQCTVYHNMP